MNERMHRARRVLVSLGCFVIAAPAAHAQDIGPDTPAIRPDASEQSLASPEGLIPSTQPQASGEAGMRPARTSVNYRIMPSDILSVTVFQEEDLKSLLRVSSEGEIVFPLIGAVSVRGLSPQEASQQIRAKLASGYLINPQVTVTVMEFAKHKFTVLGQVQKPGAFDMPDESELTLLQAIGVAGGYTRVANPRKVTLMRKGPDGKKQVFNFDARKMAEGGGDATFTVVPGDVITVAESLF